MQTRRSTPPWSRPLPNSALGAAALLALASLAGCDGDGSNAAPAFATPVVVPNAASACTAMLGKTVVAFDIGEPTNGAVVTAATLKPAVADAPNAANTALVLGNPEYCELVVEIKPLDATAPVVKSQVNLPTSWNGKKLQFGGSGYNGSVVTGLDASRGAPVNVARPLTQGYMTAGTDSGHQNQTGVEIFAFALNNEALANFGYAAYKTTHDVAVRLGLQFYGSDKRPLKSYYMGGSEGGREGMMMAQRYPNDFDGIIAVDPVMNWSGLQTFGNWVGGIQQSAPGAWLGGKTQLVHDTVVAACDSLDGIADGVVSNYKACKPLADAALAAKRCASGTDEGATCLSTAQLSTINAAHTGYTFSFALANGMRSYAGFNYGGEGLAGNWAQWLVGTTNPAAGPTAAGINQVYQFGNGYVRYFIAQNKDFNPLTYDPNAFQARVLQVSQTMDATNPDLSAFFARGGKLILREDLADTAQSPFTGLNYWDAVVARLGQSTVDNSFAAYVATGLPHTSAGIAAGGANAPSYGIPGRVDLLPVLEAWAERGVKPADQYALTLTQPLAPFTVTASKPLCRYGSFPKYVGTAAGGGSQAGNYVCAAS